MIKEMLGFAGWGDMGGVDNCFRLIFLEECVQLNLPLVIKTVCVCACVCINTVLGGACGPPVTHAEHC